MNLPSWLRQRITRLSFTSPRPARRARPPRRPPWATFGEQLEDRSVPALAGPDAFGHAAFDHPFEAIDLEPGQSGVFSILPAADDQAAPVDLGANTFRFYG